MSGWTAVSDRLPPDDALVEVTTESGDVRNLRLISGMWFLPGREMYVYFTPVMWRSVPE